MTAITTAFPPLSNVDFKLTIDQLKNCRECFCLFVCLTLVPISRSSDASLLASSLTICHPFILQINVSVNYCNVVQCLQIDSSSRSLSSKIACTNWIGVHLLQCSPSTINSLSMNIYVAHACCLNNTLCIIQFLVH